MNIHKFNVKPIYTPPKTIKWLVPDNIRQYVRKVNTTTWEVFSQEDIILKPKEVKFIMLGIGFIMSEGVVLTLSQTTNFRLFQTERVCRRQFQI